MRLANYIIFIMFLIVVFTQYGYAICLKEKVKEMGQDTFGREAEIEKIYCVELEKYVGKNYQELTEGRSKMSGFLSNPMLEMYNMVGMFDPEGEYDPNEYSFDKTNPTAISLDNELNPIDLPRRVVKVDLLNNFADKVGVKKLFKEFYIYFAMSCNREEFDQCSIDFGPNIYAIYLNDQIKKDIKTLNLKLNIVSREEIKNIKSSKIANGTLFYLKSVSPKNENIKEVINNFEKFKKDYIVMSNFFERNNLTIHYYGKNYQDLNTFSNDFDYLLKQDDLQSREDKVKNSRAVDENNTMTTSSISSEGQLDEKNIFQERVDTRESLSSHDILMSFFQRFCTNVYMVWNYPELARQQGQVGLCLLQVTITREGEVREVFIKESSGHPLLDEGAMSAVRKGASYGPLPTAYPKDDLEFIVPFQYDLESPPRVKIGSVVVI